MDYRSQEFKKRFEEAATQFKVKPNHIVSIKVRDTVNSYSVYQEFFKIIEREHGINVSKIEAHLYGHGFWLSEANNRVIIIEHETGLEILYIAGSIASLISIIPLVLQTWRAFRNRIPGMHNFGDHDLEIRRIDEKGNLIEERLHHTIGFSRSPLHIENSNMLPTAEMVEKDLRQLMKEIQSLTQRVELLEKKHTIIKSRKSQPKKK